MKEPISIIIPAYKTQAFIQECLDSFESQTYFQDFNNYEILLGIDGSEEMLDTINSIRSRYHNLSVYLMRTNYGAYITINTLLDIAKYKWALCFGSDDIALPFMVETIMAQKEEANMVQFGYYSFKNNIIFNENIDYKLRIAPGTIFFDKNLILEYGGYRPWMCGADTELLKRLHMKIRGITLMGCLFYRRMHPGSLCGRLPETNPERIRAIKYVSNMNPKADPHIEKIIGEYTHV
jgi:glycosyltransferase involved in cell wall biosynthesis